MDYFDSCLFVPVFATDDRPGYRVIARPPAAVPEAAAAPSEAQDAAAPAPSLTLADQFATRTAMVAGYHAIGLWDDRPPLLWTQAPEHYALLAPGLRPPQPPWQPATVTLRCPDVGASTLPPQQAGGGAAPSEDASKQA